MSEKPLVLILDDERLIALTTAEMLRERGLSVLPAFSSDEAIRILGDLGDEVSAIFVDVRPNGRIDGLEVARQARRQCPGIGVLYTSGDTLENMGDRGVPGGRFVGKPYDHGEVAKVLRALTARRAI